MTIEEIRNGAPPEATHYKMSRAFKGQVIYFKVTNKGLCQHLSSIGWSAPVFKLSNEIKPL